MHLGASVDVIPSELRTALLRVEAYDPRLGEHLTAVFTRVLRVADALSWARSKLPELAAAPDRQTLLEELVQQARALTAAPEVWAVTWPAPPDGGPVRFDALAGISDSGKPGYTADGQPLLPDGLSRSIVGKVAQEGRPAWSDDASADARFLEARSIQAASLRSVGCVPLGQHGVLYLYDPDTPGRFDASARARLASLCATAGSLLAAPAPAPVAGRERLPGLVGSAPAMVELARQVRAFAPMPWPCLVLGETGTGKEVVARALHSLSPRSEAPFIALNCGAIPAELAESMLFGHEKGAFTGADRQKDGVAQAVGDGTLFLDEVGDLPAPVQVKLLRLLQEGTFSRVGSHEEQRFGGRVVAATHQAIESEGSFRRDLFHRLAGCILRVPPLRDRRADIPALASFLLKRAMADLPGTPEIGLDQAAADRLAQRAWPGNVRELENAVRGAIATALARGAREIGAEDLGGGAASTPGSASVALSGDLMGATTRFQQARVRAALAATDDNRTRAAASLGVSRQWLHRLIARWDQEGAW